MQQYGKQVEERKVMKKRNSRCNSDTQQIDNEGNGGNDLSLLQRPLRTAHTGFEEARLAYENGTSEVSGTCNQRDLSAYWCHCVRDPTGFKNGVM